MLKLPDTVQNSPRQRLKPYGVESIKKEREKLFLLAYKVLLWTAFRNKGAISANLDRLLEAKTRDLDIVDRNEFANIMEAAWGAFFLLFPVVSTTFHSYSSLFSALWRVSPPRKLGTLIVDEAGQSISYMALAPLLMSKRAVVVGDPLQLEPVVTIPEEIFDAICKKYITSEEGYFYISGAGKAVSYEDNNQIVSFDSSVQVLADRASIYYDTLPKGEKGVEVGIPLRVHFRCDEKIMEVANKVAYGGFMLHFDEKPSPGVIKWINVKTPKHRWKEKNVSELETECAIGLLQNLLKRVKKEEICIISPFRAVAAALKEETKDRKLLDSNNIGTVHTFQGKEAPVVIFVLGESSPGACEWASKNPNLLNVAVTRAKKELYVIGDYEVWKDLKYFEVLAEEAFVE